MIAKSDIPSWTLTRSAFTSVTLVVSFFVWYAAILISLIKTIGTVGQPSTFAPDSQILLWFIHFSSLIVSALLGAELSIKFDRPKFIMAWIILSAFSSLILFTLNSPNLFALIIAFSVLGVSLGIGMPACMSYFSDCVHIEYRGRVSGVALLVGGIGIGVFSLVLLPAIDNLLLGITLATWQLINLVVFSVFKSTIIKEPSKHTFSYKSIVGQQPFLTYFIPWTMFSFINYLAAPLIPTEVSINLLFLVKTGLLGAFAIIGGFLVDSVGRKRVAIAGFVMLGLSSAVLGLFQPGLISQLLSSILEGAAWGLLLTLFVLILWGDLSHGISTEKYYAIGVAPFFFSKLLELTVGNFVSSSLPPTALFPFTSFFLFVAVLPLVYAPETLPDKIMKNRDLMSYIIKAKKIVEKETKNKYKDSEKAENSEEDRTKENSTDG